MDKFALVTGASRGIGKAISLRLANLGYGVFLLGRDESALKGVADLCSASNNRVEYLAGDLVEPDYLRAAVAAAIKAFGRIDVLVNNAGKSTAGAAQTLNLEQWRDGFELNLFAAAQLVAELVPAMVERRTGTVINISSISGRNTHAEGAVYAATKHAMNGFSGCLYEDVRDFGIKVSTIMPGFVDTGMTQSLGKRSEKMIQAEDIADTIEFVLSASATVCPIEIVLRPQLRP